MLSPPTIIRDNSVARRKKDAKTRARPPTFAIQMRANSNMLRTRRGGRYVSTTMGIIDSEIH